MNAKVKPPALVIDKPGILSDFTLEKLLQCRPYLKDRAICDRKLEPGETEQTLQILPYIALVDMTSMDYMSTVPPKFFFYTRGAAGGESKLYGMVSMGIGGHMEEAPDAESTDFAALDFARLIAAGAVQEIFEEVSVELPFTDFVNALIPGTYMPSNEAESVLAMNNALLMYAPVNPVDEVHIAIAFAVKMTPERIGALEEGIITRGMWATYDEMMAMTTRAENPVILETWTKILLEYLHDAWKRGSHSPLFTSYSELPKLNKHSFVDRA